MQQHQQCTKVKMTTTKGALGHVMKITLQQAKQPTCRAERRHFLKDKQQFQTNYLVNMTMVKHVKVLKSAMALPLNE